MKMGLLAAQLADLVVHILSLLGGGQQLRHSVLADGHVVEVPDEVSAPLDQLVEVSLGARRP